MAAKLRKTSRNLNNFKKVRKNKKNKSRPRKVWKIFRFKERFEMPHSFRGLRKSPLLFTKNYVGSGTDNESISYAQQMQTLRNYGNRHELKGVFHELLEIAANRSRAYRGYILDENLEPASDGKIALMLGMVSKEAATKASDILKQLSEIGLLERIDCPQFDPTEDDDPGDGERKNGDDDIENADKDNAALNTSGRRRPPAAAGAPFKKGKGKVKREAGNGKGKEKLESEPEPEMHNGNQQAAGVSVNSKGETQPEPEPEPKPEEHSGKRM